MADKVIVVSCIFLGQVGESSGTSYRTRKVALILITIWLFGYFFLVVNYYQGSIYSCLAVHLPPQTPRGVEELIELDLRMVALYAYVADDKSNKFFLLENVIPELINSTIQNPFFSSC